MTLGLISSTALGRLASSISKTPQSAFRCPLGAAWLSAAAVAPKMRLAPARLETTLFPAPSSKWLIRRAVVVLPLVPVMTIDPWVRSFASLVRILGSMTRATSPGSVVPPPRLVTRLRAPVALPARTAAVLRTELARFGCGRCVGIKTSRRQSGRPRSSISVTSGAPQFRRQPARRRSAGKMPIRCLSSATRVTWLLRALANSRRPGSMPMAASVS